MNSSCLSLETDLYGTYLSFLQENPIPAQPPAQRARPDGYVKLLPDHLGYHVHLPRAGLKATLFRVPLEPAPHGTDDLEGELGSSPLGPRVESALQSAVAHPQQPVADSRVGGFQILGYPAYAVALLPAQARQEPELCTLVLLPSCRFFQPLLADARHERGAGLQPRACAFSGVPAIAFWFHKMASISLDQYLSNLNRQIWLEAVSVGSGVATLQKLAVFPAK